MTNKEIYCMGRAEYHAESEGYSLEVWIMTNKEIYCMGRAEYLAAFEGYSFSEGYKIAEEEFEESKILLKEIENEKSKKSKQLVKSRKEDKNENR